MGKRFGKRKTLQERFDERQQKQQERFEAAQFVDPESYVPEGFVRYKFTSNGFVTCKLGARLAIFITEINEPLGPNRASRVEAVAAQNMVIEDEDGAPFPLRADGSIDLVPGKSYTIDQVIVNTPGADDERTSVYSEGYFVPPGVKAPPPAPAGRARLPSISAYTALAGAAIFQFTGLSIDQVTKDTMDREFADWVRLDQGKWVRYATGDNKLALEFAAYWLKRFVMVVNEMLPLMEAAGGKPEEPAPEPQPKLRGKRQMYLD